MRCLALVGLATLTASACVEDPYPDPVAPDGGRDAATADAMTADGGVVNGGDLFGELSVRLVAPGAGSGSSAGTPGFTSVGGKLTDRLPPEALQWVSDGAEGGCTLFKPRTPFCDPACVGEVCTAEGCMPYALPKSAGVLTVKGLNSADGKSEFTITPIGDSYTTPGDVSLPYPAFAEGAPIAVSASQAGLQVETTGIAPLVLTTTSVALSANTPVALSWMAGSNPAARILVELDISHHGGTKGKLECDVEDTGSLSISGALIGKLLDLGVAGFPTIKVSRSIRGTSKVGAGDVSLRVYADVEREVQIAGIVSCSKPSDCPAGESCGPDLLCE